MRGFLRLATLLSVLMIAQAAAAAGEDGFKPIFDGKSLEGWDGNPKFWRVEEGAITGEATAANPTKENTFLIWRGGEPADFELRLEFKLISGNSGVQYRSREEPAKWGRWVVGGYQADIAYDDTWCAVLHEERSEAPGRSIMALPGQKVVSGENHASHVVDKFGVSAELRKKVKRGEWNAYQIIAQGNHLRQIINGQLMVDVTDNDPQFRRFRGILAFQLHGGFPMKVQFRNIRLKEKSI